MDNADAQISDLSDGVHRQPAQPCSQYGKTPRSPPQLLQDFVGTGDVGLRDRIRIAAAAPRAAVIPEKFRFDIPAQRPVGQDCGIDGLEALVVEVEPVEVTVEY